MSPLVILYGALQVAPLVALCSKMGVGILPTFVAATSWGLVMELLVYANRSEVREYLIELEDVVAKNRLAKNRVASKKEKNLE